MSARRSSDGLVGLEPIGRQLLAQLAPELKAELPRALGSFHAHLGASLGRSRAQPTMPAGVECPAAIAGYGLVLGALMDQVRRTPAAGGGPDRCARAAAAAVRSALLDMDLWRDAARRPGGVRAAAVRTGECIEALHRICRIDEATLRLRNVDLSRMAAAIVGRLGADDPGRRVDIEIAGDITVRCDRALIGLVLAELLGNAWKFTAANRTARIAFGRARADPSGALFVRDNGAGFDMAEAGRLFRPFQRLHRDGAFPGAGIGLAVVERAVRRHGGAIRATSHPGQGTTVTFRV